MAQLVEEERAYLSLLAPSTMMGPATPIVALFAQPGEETKGTCLPVWRGTVTVWTVYAPEYQIYTRGLVPKQSGNLDDHLC